MKAIVIGAGFIARQHIGAIQALGDDVDLAGICDLSSGVVECVAERFGIPCWGTDYRRLLEQIRPDVVHVTTPVTSHTRIARDAITAGAHVLIEKPIAESWGQWVELREHGERHGRWIIEDHNYQFNQPTLQLMDAIDAGVLGDVMHVDAFFIVNLRGEGSPFADKNLPHPCLKVPGGAIHDFIPHMAYLVYLLIGGHRDIRAKWWKKDTDTILPSDEFRAMVTCERGTASLGFSANAEPGSFWLTVYTTAGMARINFFENRIIIDQHTTGGPLQYLRNGLAEGRAVQRTAIRSLLRKLSGGAGIYEGLYELVARMYRRIADGGPPPISIEQINATNRMVFEMTDQAPREHGA